MHEPAGAVGPAGIDNGPRQISAGHDRSTILDHTHPMASKTRPAQHHRALTEEHRRPSLVKLRSRSTTSAGSHDVSVVRRGFSTDALPEFGKGRTSPDRPKSMLQKLDKQEGFRKGLKAKSSRLFKRPENRDDLTSLGPLDWSDEFNDICPKIAEGPHSPSVSRQARKPSKDTSHRYNISEPFDFQHLTHTDASQFQRMQEASQYDIVSEFSALRASQPPRRQLQGIKAQNLTCPEEALGSPTSSRPGAPIESPRSEAPLRDKLQHSLYVPPSPSSTPDLSDEDVYSDQAVASDSPQPVISSPEPDRFGDAFALLSSRSSQILPHQPTMDYPIATWADGVYNFTLPHAVTTPDDAAHTLHPPPFHINRTELSQVLEEDECVDGKWCSVAKSANLSSTPSSDFWYNKSLLAAKQSPQKSAAAPAAQGIDEQQNQTARPPSVFEQPAHDIPFRPHSCGPSSDVGDDMEASWEDDIDWCYEHAAEADCNFDWNRRSTVPGELNAPLASFSERAAHQLPLRFTPATQGTSSVYPSVPSIMVPVHNDVPDLEPPSAISAQSSLDNVSEAVTPVQTSATDINQQFLTAACKPTCQDWLDHASPMPTQNDPESTMIYEDHFHVIYARKSLPEHGFPIGQVDGSTISSASSRSSRSPLSKSSSQESFWSRRDHRSNSGSSVPDLIQSKISSDRRAYSGEQAASTDAIATTNGDLTQSSTHRRSQSLAKDVAQKTILTKVKSCDSGPVDGGSLPPPAIHSQGRHSPDASMRGVDMWSTPFPARPFPSRSRADSLASSSGRKPSVHLLHLTVDGAQA